MGKLLVARYDHGRIGNSLADHEAGGQKIAFGAGLLGIETGALSGIYASLSQPVQTVAEVAASSMQLEPPVYHATSLLDSWVASPPIPKGISARLIQAIRLNKPLSDATGKFVDDTILPEAFYDDNIVVITSGLVLDSIAAHLDRHYPSVVPVDAVTNAASGRVWMRSYDVGLPAPQQIALPIMPMPMPTM